MTATCPCCGAPLSRPLAPGEFEHLPLTGMERNILAFIAERYPAPARTEALIDDLYQLDPNGGPRAPRNVLSVHIHHINKALLPLGWRIAATHDTRFLTGAQNAA